MTDVRQPRNSHHCSPLLSVCSHSHSVHYSPEQSKIQAKVLGHSLIHSLIRLFIHSRACGKVNDQIAILAGFFSLLDDSAVVSSIRDDIFSSSLSLSLVLFVLFFCVCSFSLFVSIQRKLTFKNNGCQKKAVLSGLERERARAR